MHKFIPACHLENVDALNTAEQKKRKKNANQNELLKFGRAKTGEKTTMNWTVVSHDSSVINSGLHPPIQRHRFTKGEERSPLFSDSLGDS